MVKIVTDSVTGLSADEARERDIAVASLFVNWNGVEYVESDLDVEEFYAKIADMVDNTPTSSQPSQHELEEIFEKISQDGDELLGVFLSSGLSGTYEGAIRAARSVAARNAGFNFRIIDACSVSYDETWPLLRAVAARDAGADLDTCVSECYEGIASSRFLFVPDSLAFLRAGGRIGAAAALIGGLVKIIPIITVTDGKVNPFVKVRTHGKAMKAMYELFKKDVEQYGIKNVVVHYIGDKTDAVAWAREKIEPLLGHAVAVKPVTPVVGVHVGPAIGIAYECASRIADKINKPLSAVVCSA